MERFRFGKSRTRTPADLVKSTREALPKLTGATNITATAGAAGGNVDLPSSDKKKVRR
jgi:hypothetical protein